MTFARTGMLFFVWAVPLALLVYIYGMRSRRRIISNYCSRDSWSIVMPHFSSGKRRVKYGLVIISLLLVAVSAAGPQYGYKWQKIERKGVDLFIAIDCSKSMLADDIKPTRLERARREVTDLLSMLEGDRVGLVAFAGTAFIQCPLTLDYQAFHLFMSAIGPDYIPVGGTDINTSILAGLKGFDQNDNTDKAIILITDGEDNTSDIKDALDEARKNNVKIFCIGVGTGESIPVPDGQGGFVKNSQGSIVMTRMDEKTLRFIAEQTGGRFVRSEAGDMDLEQIYRQDIRKEMERKTLTSSRQKLFEDRFQWFLCPAFLFMVLSMGLSSTGENRVKQGES